LHADAVALVTEIGASLVSSPCGIKGAIVRQDIKGDHFKVVKDIDQDMKNLIVKMLPQPLAKD